MRHLMLDVKAVEAPEVDTGEFEAILSTSVTDRDGEVIAAGAFEPLPESIPIYYQHDWQQKALPIGRGKPFYDDDGKLRVKGWFGADDRSQDVRKAVGDGRVDGMSAGYLPLHKSRVKGVVTVTKADLFEGSMTAIPVNKTALVTASKALESAETKAGARNNAEDSDRLQQIHDLAVDNGAYCAPMKSLKAISDKPWSDFTQADYTVEQWRDACLIIRNDGATKADCSLPVKEPDGTVNRNAVHAAAARLGQTDATDAEKTAAARKLTALYKELGEDAPDSVTSMKSIVGSVEALQDRVRDALTDAYGDQLMCLRGVVPSTDGGTCYFDSWTDEIESYSQTYTDDGNVVTLTGDPTAIDILETIQPDADADRESEELKSADNTAAQAAVKSADVLAARLKLSETALNLAFTG